MKNSIKFFFIIAIILLSSSFSQNDKNVDTLISINFKNTDILDVTAALAIKVQKNIIVHSDVKAKITANLEQVQPRRALDIICRAHKLYWVEEDDVITIYDRKSFLNNLVLANYNVEQVIVNYRPVKSIFEKICVGEKSGENKNQEGIGISMLGGKVMYDETLNSLTLIDTPENIKYLKEIIATFDKKQSAVLIEAKIINIKLDDEFRMGVNWTKLGSKFVGGDYNAASGGLIVNGKNTFKIQGKYYPFEQVIDALDKDNNIHLLSNPRISVVSDEEAYIRVGENISYKSSIVTKEGQVLDDYKFVNVGIQLRVKATIFGDSIRLEVSPQVSDAVPNEAGAPPKVDTSEASTVMYIEDGESIILGGLIDENESKLKSGIPFLSKIPLLGYLFRKTEIIKNKSELVVFIKVKIL